MCSVSVPLRLVLQCSGMFVCIIVDLTKTQQKPKTISMQASTATSDSKPDVDL